MDKDYKGKKVLILGLGINQGGVGAAKFFAKAQAKVRVTDLKDKKDLKLSLDQLKNFKNIEYILGKHRFEDIDWADLIIRNPALKPDNPYLLYARKKGKKIETDMGIFLQFVDPGQVIGITGTKGKSTTASLIYKILKENVTLSDSEAISKNPYISKIASSPTAPRNDGDVVFAGNIGKSVLDAIPSSKPDTSVVLEISSFQLEAFDEHKTAPKYALITNIYPDHLNYYKNFNEYKTSKKLIFKYQKNGDFLFIRKGDRVLDNPEFLKGFNGKKIYFSSKILPQNFKSLLVGEHNRENMAAALAVAEILDINAMKALKVIKKFRGVEYRLQKIYDKGGIKIYNDSAATNPNAAIAALKTLASHPEGGNSNVILIAGGVNKNLDYRDFAMAIEKHAKSVYFLKGTATQKIKEELLTSNHQSSEKIMGTYNNLSHVLKIVMSHTKPGDIILFSPGAASFNLFQNEFDRGRKFNLAVAKALGRN